MAEKSTAEQRLKRMEERVQAERKRIDLKKQIATSKAELAKLQQKRK